MEMRKQFSISFTKTPIQAKKKKKKEKKRKEKEKTALMNFSNCINHKLITKSS